MGGRQQKPRIPTIYPCVFSMESLLTAVFSAQPPGGNESLVLEFERTQESSQRSCMEPRATRGQPMPRVPGARMQMAPGQINDA